ncbi:MAG: hypothetical protein IJN96_06745 [Clostridia bacterium]|nr:hypothetical protein [Clostridia bacterium]
MMQVWEKINNLKGTNASKEQIASWAYSNKICPVEFADELELDCEYPSELTEISNKLCDNNTCGFECLTKFLESEVQEDE